VHNTNTCGSRTDARGSGKKEDVVVCKEGGFP